MKIIEFFKYQGTGNDFVMIDNRNNQFPKENHQLVNFICDRRFGVGADGLILLENDTDYDFKMVYYNADGNESTMCGNGGRCIVMFAKDLGIINKETKFLAVDGEHIANILSNQNVALQMIDVVKDDINVNESNVFLFTGSPHHIAFAENLKMFDVYTKGKEIRYSDIYAPGGTNVNFVEQLDTSKFKIRTYERGVEDETLSCGTGATAVALAMYTLKKTTSKIVDIVVEGGNLQISFNENADKFTDVMLIGEAKQVFKGELNI